MPDTGLELFDGHLIVDAGGRMLLDTGSPVSFSSTGTVHWAGEEHELATSVLGLDAEELSRLVGTRLDGLIGGDHLGREPFTIDLERGVCSFAERGSDRPSTELRIRLMLGVPLATVEFDGAPAEACIDTGAKLSYLDEAHVRGRAPVEETSDFYPGFGTFETPVYEIPVRIAGAALTMRVGSLPDGLSGMLGMLGIAAIVGTDVFATFPVARFDYQNTLITFASRHDARRLNTHGRTLSRSLDFASRTRGARR